MLYGWEYGELLLMIVGVSLLMALVLYSCAEMIREIVNYNDKKRRLYSKKMTWYIKVGLKETAEIKDAEWYDTFIRM